MTGEKSKYEESAVELLKKVTGAMDSQPHPQQLAIIHEIVDAVDNKHQLIIQAGTGSGKSFAELIPAIVDPQKRRWLFATATIQLSEQLSDKDIPFLSKHIEGYDTSVAIVRGRSNYFCPLAFEKTKRATDEVGDSYDLDAKYSRSKRVELAKELYEWAGDTYKKLSSGEVTDEIFATAVRSQAPGESAGNEALWRSYSMPSASCPGEKICPKAYICPAEHAIQKALRSRIVVTTHAYAAQQLLNPDLLGEFDVIVFDEIHEADSYLTSAWGAELGKKDIADFVKKVKKPARLTQEKSDELTRVGRNIFTQATSITSKTKSSTLLNAENSKKITRLLVSAAEQVNEIVNKVRAGSGWDKSTTLRSLVKEGTTLEETLSKLALDDERNIRWIDYEDNSWKKHGDKTAVLSVKTAPLRVGPLLQELLQSQGSVFIGTSATATHWGKFDTIRHQLELPEDAVTADVGSPFDFPKQAILSIPKDFPLPLGDTRMEHQSRFFKLCTELAEVNGGRSMFLTTSKKVAGYLYDYLQTHLKDMNIIDATQLPPGGGAKTFKAVGGEGTVMVGTTGLWSGVDIPGNDLTCIVLEKLPFPVFGDPVTEARGEWEKENNGTNPFFAVSLPKAVTTLQQGFGRLIRSRNDKGLVVLCDPRIYTKGYGKQVLASLPPVYLEPDERKAVDAMSRLAETY